MNSLNSFPGSTWERLYRGSASVETVKDSRLTMSDIIICPGIHPSALTQEFLQGLGWQPDNMLIFPTEKYPAYSWFDILQFLRYNICPESPLIAIGFSAGAVGAIGACWAWQMLGGRVKAFIALDAWGVPLWGNFPIHRLSHDYFTHWTSALLGAGEDSFYAEPPVEHLDLWREPQSVQGWWVSGAEGKSLTPLTAAGFLRNLLERYKEPR